MTIIDTHAHIDQIQPLSETLQKASEVGVSDIMAMSVDLESMRAVLNISATYKTPRIHPALGIHPGKVNAMEHLDAISFLSQHIKHAIAVGETGLDFWYKWVKDNDAERQKQKDSFLFHLKLAKEQNLPIVIHSRGAWSECYEMAQSQGVTRALFHWYSGPVDVMAKILEAGYYVSTSPSVAYSQQSREAMRVAPLDRILIETDAPVVYRPQEGEYLAQPKDVWKTLKALSDLKNLDEDAVRESVNTNARQFFGIKS